METMKFRWELTGDTEYLEDPKNGEFYIGEVYSPKGHTRHLATIYLRGKNKSEGFYSQHEAKRWVERSAK